MRPSRDVYSLMPPAEHCHSILLGHSPLLPSPAAIEPLLHIPQMMPPAEYYHGVLPGHSPLLLSPAAIEPQLHVLCMMQPAEDFRKVLLLRHRYPLLYSSNTLTPTTSPLSATS